MGGTIRRLVTPPVFVGDEDKTRAASLLNTILLGLLGILLASTITLPFADEIRTGVVSIGAMFAAGLTALIVMRLGYVSASAVIFSGLMWGFYAVLILVSGGVNGPMNSGPVLLVVIAGLVLGGRGAVVFAALGTITVAGIYAYESTGALPDSLLGTSTMIGLATTVANILLAAVLLYLATSRLNEALSRARQNERRAVTSNQESEALRASLDERNRTLQSAVTRYGDFMAEVAQGKLAGRLEMESSSEGSDDDPLLVLGRAINDAVESLQSMIGRMRESARALSSAAAEIQATTAQQLSNASEQSAAISQTSTTVDEVRNIAEQTVLRAQEVAEAAKQSAEFSQGGLGAVQSSIQSMGLIRQRVEGIAENILALSEQTQQIGQIIATVDEIASQSNMLALNASVEAARAGEQGKGFAIVAMEVRALAEQSKHATTQVEDILSEIQKATNMTVMATEEGTKGVEEGVELSFASGEVIQQLAGVITQASQAAAQMVAGGQQQTSGIEQIALAMGNINQATVQNLEGTRQAERAARDMAELAQSLREMAEQYSL
jgi:methyl-accepting chemotaxis protein